MSEIEKTIQRQGKAVADEAGKMAGKAVEGGREAVGAMSDGLASATKEARRMVADEVGTRVEAGKEKVAETADRLADGLRDASGAADRGFQQQVFGTLADGLSELSGQVRHLTPGRAMKQLETMARRYPGAFVAGAALAGFAAARLVVASSHAARSSGPAEKDGHGDGYGA